MGVLRHLSFSRESAKGKKSGFIVVGRGSETKNRNRGRRLSSTSTTSGAVLKEERVRRSMFTGNECILGKAMYLESLRGLSQYLFGVEGSRGGGKGPMKGTSTTSPSSFGGGVLKERGGGRARRSRKRLAGGKALETAGMQNISCFRIGSGGITKTVRGQKKRGSGYPTLLPRQNHRLKTAPSVQKPIRVTNKTRGLLTNLAFRGELPTPTTFPFKEKEETRHKKKASRLKVKIDNGKGDTGKSHSTP